MTELDLFFEDCESAFADAQAQVRSAESRRLVIEPAGVKIRLNILGRDCVALTTPALEHIAGDNGGDGCPEFSVWDRTSSGISLPPCPWKPDAHRARGDIDGLQSPSLKLAYGLGVNVLSIWNEDKQRGLFHPLNPSQIPRVYFGSPFLHLLHWVGESRGLQLIHGAAVASDGCGLLLAGRGGAGKSTASLACLHEGLDYLGDDYCFVSPSPEPKVYSIFSSGKLRPSHLESLPRFEPLIFNRDEIDHQKALLMLYPYFREQITPQARLMGIVMPRVTGQVASSIEKASRGDALRILGASTLFQMAGSSAINLSQIGDLVRRLPVFYLNSGSDLSTIGLAMSGLIDQLRNQK